MSKHLARPYLLLAGVMTLLVVAALACTTEKEVPVTVIVEKTVDKIVEVPVTVIVEKTVEVAAMADVPACDVKLGAPGKAGFPDRSLSAKQPTAYSDQELEAEQTLQVAVKYNLERLQPWQSPTDMGRSYNTWSYMGLTQFGGSIGQLRAGVALSYGVGDDELTYTWCLDPDAIYQDGTPVTAASIKKYWEWTAFPENQAAWGANLLHLLRFIRGFDKVETGETTDASGLIALDDLTLQTILKSPDPPFPARTAVWFSGIMKADHCIADKDECTRAPIGIGPYDAVIEPTTGNVTLTASANWWREPPLIQKIVMTVVGDQSVHQIMLENDELDLIYSDAVETPWAYAHDYLVDDLYFTPVPGMWMWVFDTTKAPFDDINVRAAITHAIDWDAIVNTVFQPGGVMTRGFQGIYMTCFNESYRNLPYGGYEFDVQKAKDFLAKSKYDVADFPDITVAMNRPKMIRAMEVAQEMVKDNLGIDITVIALEGGQQRPEAANLYRSSTGAMVPDPSSLMTELGHSKNSDSKGSNHFNRELDGLIDAANALALDDPGRCQAYNDAEQLFYDQYYMMMGLAQDDTAWLARPWVLGFETTFGLDWASLPWMRIGKRDASLYK